MVLYYYFEDLNLILTSENHIVNIEKRIVRQIFTLLISSAFIFSAYLRDVPIDLTQPSGEAFSCFVSGDEYYNRFHDESGYTIVQSQDGYYYYAEIIEGNILPSSYRADQIHNLESLGISENIIII